ncbi:MAG: hypothetical protein Q9201_006870 [Fulgogasparrea decipioides]
MPRDGGVGNIHAGMANMKLESSASSKAPRGTKMEHIFNNKVVPAKETQLRPNQAREESEGWTTVKSVRPPTTSRPPQKGNNVNQPPKGSFMPTNTSSAAAQARRQPYENRTKVDSQYKQSCLPVDQRNPELAEKEANASKAHQHKKGEYRPGMIIRGMLHEQDFIAASTSSNITVTDRSHHNTEHGRICTKWRKMIVLAMFEDHYLAIPLFTHNGNGLEHKTKREEFISIKDHRDRHNHPAQSRNGWLVTETINDGIDLFHVKSTAHVTYALSRRYDLPVVKEGYLTRDSTNHLIALFNQYAPKPLLDRR